VTDSGEEEADDPAGMLFERGERQRVEVVTRVGIVLQAEQVGGGVWERFEAGSVGAPGARLQPAWVGDDCEVVEACESVE
jgi:hypothetical protein